MGGRGGSSGMSVRESQSNYGSLGEIENKIRHNSIETAALIGPNGEVLFDKSDGLKDEVHFTAKETAMMVDATLTHNHPMGTTFSEEDVDLAVSKGLRNIRAVHSGGSYELTRQYDVGDDVPSKYMKFSKDYQSAVSGYMKNTVDGVWNKTGDAVRCNNMVADFRRQWLKDNSADYGWNYKEGN